MKKKNLSLSKETLRQLTAARLEHVVGGVVQVTVRGGEANSCGCNTQSDDCGGHNTAGCPD